MVNKKIVISVCVSILLLLAGGFFAVNTSSQGHTTVQTQTVDARQVASQIAADGVVTAQNEAVLHFQTGGKVVYLPFKAGDHVSQGATIAQLDTYALQRAMTQSLNLYRSARDTFDQTQQNAQNNVLQTQQKPLTSGAQMDQSNAINDAVKRIADQNQATLDNSVIAVELSNYAVQLATLTSPLNGILVQQDITVPNVNVTTATSFVVADPGTIAFRANVLQTDIDYVSVGASATISINGSGKTYTGVVDKIYPSKITFSDGSQGYQVDIVSTFLRSTGKLDQGGSVLIQSNANQAVTLIPRWVVLSGDMVWTENNGRAELKKVQIGNVHGDNIEVLSGLSQGDKVIVDPKSVAIKRYQML